MRNRVFDLVWILRNNVFKESHLPEIKYNFSLFLNPWRIAAENGAVRFFGGSLRRRGRARQEEQADRSRGCNRRSRLQCAALFTVAINSEACELGAPTCGAAAAAVAVAVVAVATARRARAFVQNILAPRWRNSPGRSPGCRIDY